MNLLRFLSPTGYICIGLVVLMLTSGGAGFYFKSQLDSIKVKKQQLDKDLEQAKKDFESCNRTISIINELMIDKAKLEDKQKQRIKKVKNVYKKSHKKYVPFNKLFPAGK